MIHSPPPQLAGPPEAESGIGKDPTFDRGLATLAMAGHMAGGWGVGRLAIMACQYWLVELGLAIASCDVAWLVADYHTQYHNGVTNGFFACLPSLARLWWERPKSSPIQSYVAVKSLSLLLLTCLILIGSLCTSDFTKRITFGSFWFGTAELIHTGSFN